METPTNTTQHLPEEILTEILARLPLRNISIFKSVSKTWKSALESVYFRCLFVSIHQNTSSCWSLLLRGREFIDFHGCKIWGLPKPLNSYIQNIEINGKFKYMASSNGLVLMHSVFDTSTIYVGNPVLQQWVEIPSPPDSCLSLFSLMTRVDEDGVVMSFKVVCSCSTTMSQDGSFVSFLVYSSETVIWICKQFFFPIYIPNLYSPMSLNGILYFPQTYSFIDGPAELMAHDFYGKSNQFQVIPLPDQNLDHNNQLFKTALTTSSGFVMYIKTLAQRGDNLLNVWRLINDSVWQLLWEISLPFIQFDISYYAPMAMHPFDRNVVYIWSQENRYLISYNMQTKNYKILGDESQNQDCFINQSVCEKHMDVIYEPRRVQAYRFPVILYPFVLPRWMESMPRPPQVEIINTTSLLSYVPSRALITSMQKDEKE